jgi:WD40 repeat protein
MKLIVKKAIQPKELKMIKPDRQLCMVRYSPCGTVLAAGSQDGTIRRWDATTDQFTELPPVRGHHGWVQALAFHSDRRRLFAGDSWGQLCAWPFGEKEAKALWQVPRAHDGWIRGLALSPDGKLLASCGSDSKVCLWSVEDGTKKREMKHKDDVFAVAFHPDGQSLVSGDLKGMLQQWETASGKPMRALDAHSLYRLDRLQDVGGVRCIAFDARGTRVACGGIQPKGGGNVQGVPTILVFDWQSGKLQKTLTVGNDGDGFVYDMLWHPDGFLMAVTSGNPGTGKFFLQRPEEPQPFFLHTRLANCHSVSLHPDLRHFVVTATNGGSNGNGRRLKNNEYPGNWSPVHVWDLTPPPAPAAAPAKPKREPAKAKS